MKCWDAKVENRPTAKGLYQLFTKWFNEIIENGNNRENYESNRLNGDNNNSKCNNLESEIYSQIKVCDKIKESEFINRLNEDKSENINTPTSNLY
jgi:hypothetical protein